VFLYLLKPIMFLLVEAVLLILKIEDLRVDVLTLALVVLQILVHRHSMVSLD
jgi:hypothetical protein